MENILFEADGAIAQLTINRPQALNALNRKTLTEIGEAIAMIGADVRALIITGAGDRAFVAGADIAEMQSLTPEEATRMSRLGQEVFSSIEALPIPAIAAVNGFALGGGCELAMACDLIYASSRARFGQPEVKLAVIPGFGGTQRLSRLVGPQLARELIYTGRIIDAECAHRIGLVAGVFEPTELLEACRSTALEIAKAGPLAVAAAKQAILRGADVPLSQALEMEAKAFGELFGSRDQSEGMAAFVEKRKAVFNGS
jgi:enoyl-CoA hydratase